jgi:hypothetical protein
VIDDAVEALERRNVESQIVNALAKTLEWAVNQRSDEAGIVVVISVGTAIYLASRWIRGSPAASTRCSTMSTQAAAFAA